MRIEWKKILLLSVLAGLIALFLRGYWIARCARAPQSDLSTAPVICVYDEKQAQSLEMPIEAYLVGVTAAEMPLSFPLEARKAQSIAARTYTVYHMLHGGCNRHDADVCTSSACCQAYLDDARMRARWGDSYQENLEQAEQAVRETAGRILLYDGAPIEALYHSASGGQTENVEDVYSAKLPYLRAVMSTAEAGTNRLIGSKQFTLKQFCETVNARFPNAKLTPKNAAQRVKIEQTTASGRVQRLRLGGDIATGRQARGLFSLDSALFTLTFTSTHAVFETRGYGHGVGMSQTGANVMALGGATCEQILRYYYTDVDVASAW